jgi:hypothetical protein
MPPSPTNLEKFWPFFPLAFVGMWLLASFLIAQMGWRSFSSKYPIRSRPPGRVYRSPVTTFGFFSSCGNVIRVIFTDAGIYFYVSFPFRAFHAPFLLPWASVRRVEKKEGFFRRGYLLEIEDTAGKIRVRLPLKAADDLFRYDQALQPE